MVTGRDICYIIFSNIINLSLFFNLAAWNSLKTIFSHQILKIVIFWGYVIN